MEAPCTSRPNDDHHVQDAEDYDRPEETSSASSGRSIPSRSSLSLNSSAATSPGASHLYWSRKNSSPPDRAVAIRSDLTNYLALGCLCFEDFSCSEAHDKPGDWVEVTTLPLLAFDQTVGSNLSKLLSNGWIRAQFTRSTKVDEWLIFRIYLLYSDVGNSFINRNDKKLTMALEGILSELDTSPETWNGRYRPGQESSFDLWASGDEENSSLFYLFNKLPSPNPRPSDIKQKYSREALEDLLDCDSDIRGLKTPLYPYQRRSAGAMVHRECVSRMELDPRYEERVAPDGSRFYYSARDLSFPRDAPLQQSCQGGILAETMGLGKTLICLALILSTRDHPPKVPVQYSALPVRSHVAGLAEMAVSAINRKSIPWKVEFERERHATGNDFEKCVQMLDQNPGSYEIPRIPVRWNRNTTLPPPQRVILTSTTIIVVPQNLLKQWRSEIQKHVEAGALQVLVMDDRREELPAPDELRKFDVILFTRNRFDMESRDGQDSEGRRVSKAPLVCRCPYIGATRKRDCHCLQEDSLYDSPLKYLHFRRIIVDEGHFFSSSNTNTVLVANRLVKADHRWSVSGTPARDLLGVEVDTSVISESKEGRDAILERRRIFNPIEDKSGAIESLGSLASTFLQVEPWAQGRAAWKDYVFRHEEHRHTFSGFSTCLRRTLEELVVKTRPEDVERDIQLPPLHHTVVRLKPSLYDIFTANLFTLVLTANAVTSERTDADYLFHPNSQRSRYQLVSNLRKSTFFWTGFSEDDVHASMSNAKKYLAKEGTGCSQEDRELMIETLECTDAILGSRGWKAMSKSHELGVFIDEWPDESAEHWAFDDSRSPVLTGITQLLDAQRFVNERLAQDDPGEGLSGQGIRALIPLRDSPEVKQETAQDVHDDATAKNTEKTKSKKPSKKSSIKTALAEKQLLSKSGIPMSSIDGEPRKRNDKALRLPAKAFRVTKRRKEKSLRKLSIKKDNDDPHAHEASPTPDPQLRSDSQYARARIVGTTSAKMSYLISQIIKYQRDEKILVFYEGDNIAYYLAQVLELLDIKHEIYAKSLQNRLKSEYVVDFDLGTDTRVLLMDVGQAAFGLNLSSASRIYFVNPVLRPQVESQAIKRAHRIGQTKRVHVETLLLQDTVEEKMFQRSKRMTAEEHKVKAVEDDGGMREIIQSSRVLNVPEEQRESSRHQMAPLESHEQLWGRMGWRDFIVFANRKRKRRGTLENVSDEQSEVIQQEEHPQVIVKRQRTESVDLGHSADSQSTSNDSNVHEYFRKGSIFGPNSTLPGWWQPERPSGSAL